MIIDILLYKSYLTSNNDSATTPLVTGCIGAIFSLIGAIMHNHRKKLIKKGVQVAGTVISIERERNTKDSTLLNYPVISYQTLQNELITKKHNIGISNGFSYKEGDSVNVIYDPDDVSSFTLNDMSSKITSVIFILFGLILVLVAIVMYIMNIR